MDYRDISRAIVFIRPNAEFLLANDEITWLDKTQTEPTKAEIEAGIAALKIEDAKAKEAAIAAKEVAIAKLAALGLDIDDLKSLGF